MGGELFACPACGTFHYAYHSCNDRHCPLCGQTDADQWLADHTALLLPTPYFLVTFTVPEPLRAWIRSHPAVGLDLLFATSAQALQELAANPQRLGASLGMLGVLHTWSRTLIYHPHVHYLVPAGGLSLDQRQWIPSRPKFLVHVHPLADHFRTLFRQALERDAPEALATLPARVWKHPLGRPLPAGRFRRDTPSATSAATSSRPPPATAPSNCAPTVGSAGPTATAPPVAPPTSIWNLPSWSAGSSSMSCPPASIASVASAGCIPPPAPKLNRVRALLHQAPLLTDAERAAWQPPDEALEPPEPLPPPERTPLCPRCQRPMTRIGSWRPGHPQLRPPARAPP